MMTYQQIERDAAARRTHMMEKAAAARVVETPDGAVFVSRRRRNWAGFVGTLLSVFRS